MAWLGGELAGRFAFTAEARFPGCAELAGEVEVLEPWIDPDTGRPAAISRDRLRRLAQRFLPIEVSGDPIQYQIHRAPLGWTVELVNNRGVAKRPDRPAVIDAKAVARVRLKPRMACKAARGWRSSRIHEDASPAEVEIGPGAVEFVEFAAGE